MNTNIDDLFQFYEYKKRGLKPKKKTFPLVIGKLYLNYDGKWCTYDGKMINMHCKSFELFYAICKRNGEFVSRPDLQKEVFPEKKYSRFTSWVAATVWWIRQRLGHDIIIAKHGCGYRLNLEYGCGSEEKSLQVA